MAKQEIKYVFTAEDSKFKQAAESVKSELSKMAKDGTLGLAALSTAFYALGRSMQATLDTMDKISKMSLKTGVSTESLSALKYAAELSDISLESLEKSFIKLSKSVEAGSPAFKTLNIDVKDSNGTLKSNEDIMMAVADAFAGMENGAQKTALATEIFGKAGADMIPLLNSGSEAIRAQMQEAENLGITFDTVAGQKAERFNDSLTTLKNSAEGFTQELVLALMPALDSLSGGFETASGKSTSLKDKLTPLQAIARGIATGFLLVVEAVKLMGYHFGFMIAIVWDVISAVGTLGKSLFYAITGQFEKAAMETAKVFDDPFAKITMMFGKLGEELKQFKNNLYNTAYGTTSYGMDSFTWTTNGGSSGTEEDVVSDKSNSAKKLTDIEIEKTKKAKEELDKALRLLEIDHKKALNLIEIDDYELRLKQERNFLLNKKRLYEEFLVKNPSIKDEINLKIVGLDTDLIENSKKSDENILENIKKLIDKDVKSKTDSYSGYFPKLNELSTKIDSVSIKLFNQTNPAIIKELESELKSLNNELRMEIVKTYNDLIAQNSSYDVGLNRQKLETKGDRLGLLNLDKEEALKELNEILIKAEEFSEYYGENKVSIENTHNEKKMQLLEIYAEKERQIQFQLEQDKQAMMSETFGMAAELFAKHTVMYKAFAIAQATIDAYRSFTKALAELPPVWAEIQAGLSLAAGLANVARIADVQIPGFAKGGIVDRPTLGLIGEAGAEIIAPVSDYAAGQALLVRETMNYFTKIQPTNFGVSGRLVLKGNDLVYALERNQNNFNRLGV